MLDELGEVCGRAEAARERDAGRQRLLHLGIGQLVAGDKAKAQATFKTVQGTDGTADLARLWALYARRGTA